MTPEKNKVPSASEFYSSFVIKYKSDGKTLDLMNQFAKLHVEQALKKASKKAKIKKTYRSTGSSILVKKVIDKESILNAYPLENVK